MSEKRLIPHLETYGLTPLGYKIFLDRYAEKDLNRDNITANDIVIVVQDSDHDLSQKRSIGLYLEDIDTDSGKVYLYETDETITVAKRYIDRPTETNPEQLWNRMARGAAQIESENKQGEWFEKFYSILSDWKFVAGGRIMTGLGTDQQLTYSNCFVIPSPHDSRGGIMKTLAEMAEIMSRGGGVGINTSTLRPKRSYVKGVNGRSSGAVSWGALYSFVTGLIEQGGSRRGALILIMNDWHPDVIEFINSKREAGKITNANISVGISDAFMEAVKNDENWTLRFPDTSFENYDDLWDGNLERWENNGYPVIEYQTMKARELWRMITDSAWSSAEPGLWFRERSNKMSNTYYFSELVSTNPCGEIPLTEFGVCNLGAINLSKFVTDSGIIMWSELQETAEIATRFMDNVIDATPYFFERNEQVQKRNERRIGLGIMGLAELMIKAGVRYGSQESIEITERIMKTIALSAYNSSSDIASEKGSFEKFDSEQFLASGYVLNLPDELREKIRKQGMRNVQLTTVAPTGCVTDDTLISTGSGIKEIGSMGNISGEQWQDIEDTVITDEGEAQATKFFVNGFVETKKITTSRGYKIEASPKHRLRVIDDNGDYVWKYVSDINSGDTMVLQRDTSVIRDTGVKLQQIDYEHFNSNVEKIPERMSPEFAELIGYYMGDGYTKDRSGINLIINEQDTDLIDHFKSIGKNLFGNVNFPIENRVGCKVLTISGRSIVRFMKINNLVKPKGNKGEGSFGAFIPAQILESGRECISAFLRGLFEANGSATQQVVSHSTVSQRLSEQVQVALLSLNIVTQRRCFEKNGNSFGKRKIWRTRAVNRRECVRFRENVGFISSRKRKALEKIEPFDRGDNIQNATMLDNYYKASNGIKDGSRQVLRSRIGNGSLTTEFVKEYSETHEQMKTTKLYKLVNQGAFFDDVVEINDSEAYTYDITVPSNNTYIANGFVSHNSSGTMVNTSTGIEPYFSWKWYRKGRLGLHEENARIVKWYMNQNGITDDNFNKPEEFVTAMELTPYEHVTIMASAQKWVDQSISKTINTPSTWTVEQVDELYRHMYDLGCKGGTIYRDGSRDEQVLMLSDDETDTQETPAVNTELYNQSRMTELSGKTIRGDTPYGTVFVTVNEDPEGVPFEVFITIGKSGSDLQASAESTGRMYSTALRSVAPEHRKAMLSRLAEQNRGIGGSRPFGFGKNRVSSLYDAIAKIIQESYLKESTEYDAFDSALSEIEMQPVTITHNAAMCPSCGDLSLVSEEGCKHCFSCGHSEC